MTTLDYQLRQVKQLIQAGRRKDAAVLLRQLVKGEGEGDYRVWLYLAMVVPARSRVRCVAEAERLAPDAVGVARAKQWLARQEGGAQVVAMAMPAAPISPSEPATSNRSFKGVLLWGSVVALLLLLAAGAYFSLGGDQLVENDSDQGLDAEVVAVISMTATAEPTATATDLPTVVPTNTPMPTSTPAVIQPKQVVVNALSDQGEPRARWTMTPEPSPTPSPTPTLEPTFAAEEYVGLSWPDVGENEKWIDVNLTKQHLTAFIGKTAVFDTPISSGRPPYFTVTGQFRIYYRLESQTMDGRRLGFDYVTEGVPHVQYFYGDFALHGAYWHEDFGQPMSHGCVNLSLPDAEWLYQWADYGTLVNVHY